MPFGASSAHLSIFIARNAQILLHALCGNGGAYMEEIQKDYNLTVKHNLRAFLLTAEYKIDQWGRFDTKEDDIKRFYTLADLCRKLSEKASSENLAKKLSGNLKKMKHGNEEEVQKFYALLGEK